MRVFTTGQVAKICKVAPRTVSKWFDSKDLVGYRIPSSKDRRIPEANLREFMSINEMPEELLNDFIVELESTKKETDPLILAAEHDFDEQLVSAGTE